MVDPEEEEKHKDTVPPVEPVLINQVGMRLSVQESMELRETVRGLYGKWKSWKPGWRTRPSPLLK